MLSNHLKLIVRQFSRNRSFTIINLAGLTIGITVSLFVAQFVWFEWSFERFNENADRTYRVNLYNTTNGVFDAIESGTVPGLGYAIQQNIPGVESVARISYKTEAVVSSSDREVEDIESEIVRADASIVKVLGMELISGDQNRLLKAPQSVLISESVARKYFGDVNATGRLLYIGFNDGNVAPKEYEVEAVFHDIPENSIQRFHFILPPENQQEWDENWAWSDVQTYIVLPEITIAKDLNAGLAKIVKEYHKDDTGDKYLLEPIKDIRLNALDGSGRASLVNFFIALGGVIVLLAWFNYVNLSTASFFERMKEIGVRKLIGAMRTQLVFQFLAEVFIFNIISFSLATLLFVICWPWIAQYNRITEFQTLLREPLAFVYSAGFIVISTLFCGLYPSFFLSSFKPIQSLKGQLSSFTKRSSLRKYLVVVQLSISVILITAVLAIERQISFMRSQNIGISIEQTIIIDRPLLRDATSVKRYEPFRDEILQLPSVSGVTFATSFPGPEIDWHRTDITLGEENVGYRYDSRIVGIGTEFLDVFGLHLLAGRNFDPDVEGALKPDKGIIINEEAVRMFSFKDNDDALHKLIFVGSRKFEIIGVVKNYHFRSLKHHVQPLLYMQGYPATPLYGIKINNNNISETISSIESKWKATYPGNVFRYSFLNDQFQKEYANDQQLETIVAGLTGLAIVISCLGLFGLSLYSVNQRVKEIGIRKILGASVLNVVVLLSGTFLRLVVIGGVIGIPVIYFGLNRWLERYAYKIPVGISLFAWPVVIVTLLTLLIISFQTITAAMANPVENIKSGE